MSASPFYFGAGHSMLGWWHPPQGAVRGTVLMCESFGYDAMCVHWAHRVLAERLATAGFAVLRFDARGAGDSLDVDSSQDFVASWRGSLLEAAVAAREFGGGGPMVWLGVRLGATLATVVASEHSRPPDALVLVEPVAQGRTFLREMKALALTAAPEIGGPPVSLPDGSLEVLGYRLSAVTQQAFSALDARVLKSAPAQQVLALHRADRPLDPKFLAALRATAAQVTQLQGEQLHLLFQDAVLSQEPAADFERVVDWLQERFTPDATGSCPGPGPGLTSPHLSDAGYVEEVALIGPTQRLASVLCRPAGQSPTGPTLVVLNTGANHRVGSHRATVRLARTLARAGFVTLRLDLGGLGDSPVQSGQQQNASRNPGSVADVQRALDWLEQRGHTNFMLTGTCSGGYYSFYAALADPRVRGIVMTNAGHLGWHQGKVPAATLKKGLRSSAYYFERVRNPQTWRRLVAGDLHLRTLVPGLVGRVARVGTRIAQNRLSRLFGARFESDPITKGFLTLLERRVSVSFIFSEGDGARDNLALHLGPGLARLDGHPLVHHDVLDGADHVLTPPRAQERWTNLIKQRLEELHG